MFWSLSGTDKCWVIVWFYVCVQGEGLRKWENFWMEETLALIHSLTLQIKPSPLPLTNFMLIRILKTKVNQGLDQLVLLVTQKSVVMLQTNLILVMTTLSIFF